MAQTENIVGNTYNKYRTKSPVAHFLTQRFTNQVRRIVQKQSPCELLDVGCGEGYLLTDVYSKCKSVQRVVACDLETEQLLPDVRRLAEFRKCSVYDLPFDDSSFDLVCCLEVLEHLTDPAAALQEICRVARNDVLISVPREPLWRMLNLCRGQYWTAMGNTPGHIQHFSRRAITKLLAGYFQRLVATGPLPWTIVQCRIPVR